MNEWDLNSLLINFSTEKMQVRKSWEWWTELHDLPVASSVSSTLNTVSLKPVPIFFAQYLNHMVW